MGRKQKMTRLLKTHGIFLIRIETDLQFIPSVVMQ